MAALRILCAFGVLVGMCPVSQHAQQQGPNSVRPEIYLIFYHMFTETTDCVVNGIVHILYSLYSPAYFVCYWRIPLHTIVNSDCIWFSQDPRPWLSHQDIFKKLQDLQTVNNKHGNTRHLTCNKVTATAVPSWMVCNAPKCAVWSLYWTFTAPVELLKCHGTKV